MEAQEQNITNQYQYQYQTLDNSTTINSTSQSYDTSSQIQSYDPQSYYASYPQQQTSLDYSNSYYYPNYSHSYQSHDPNSIYPPGVPVSTDNQQTQVPNSQNLYYQSSQTHGYFQPGQTGYGDGGGQGGRSTRGRGRGTFGRRGRGRGGGRGAVEAAPSKAPQMAWCELCRVDCTTLEILEKHKNGKKHLRNVKVFEELQNSTQPITLANVNQVSMTQPKPDGSDPNLFSTEHVPSVMPEGSGTRGGLKRKTKAGRGGKFIRAPDGSRRFVSTPLPKMVPILCELCNVKCESQIVYESHVAGKKHLSTLKRYQGHKETFGESVEALYPTIPITPQIHHHVAQDAQAHHQVPQDAQALYQVPQNAQTHHQFPVPHNAQAQYQVPVPHDAQAQYQVPIPQEVQAQQQVSVPQDAHALASMMLSHQNLPDPQGAQAAVAQLLNEHGIHDAQTLIVQLIPYLLSQSQGSVPLPGAATNDLLLQKSQEPPVTTEAEGKNVGIKTEEQNLGGSVEPDSGAGTSDKPEDLSSGGAGTNNKSDDGSSEAVKAGAE